MNKSCIIFFIFIIPLFAFSKTIFLKEELYTNKKNITLNDISSLPLDENENLEIKFIEENPSIITIDDILKVLFQNSIYDISIIGKKCIIYDNKNNYLKNKVSYNNFTPLDNLKQILNTFIDTDYINLDIKAIKVEPELKLNRIKDNYEWILDKSNYSIKDLQNLKQTTFLFKGLKYNIELEVNIFSKVWISNQSFLKNDFLRKEAFYLKTINISNDKKIESIISDIDNANNTQFVSNISPGDILRWNYLKKNPIVYKGEVLKLFFYKNNFEIVLPCIALKDGYENERVKVRLVNGKELFGTIIKNTNGVNYVEL